MTRQEVNRKILEKISAVVEREPDWRFHQILINMGIEVPEPNDRNYIDPWFEESEVTLNEIDPSIS